MDDAKTPRLIAYRDKAAYMVFRGDTHIADIPYGLLTAPKRRYTPDEANAGVSYPGAEPGPEHCIPAGYATHTMTYAEHKASMSDDIKPILVETP